MNTFKLLNAYCHGMIKEMGILNRTAYSENKVEIKAIFKACGLIFNQNEYHDNEKFIWADTNMSVEAKYVKEEVKIIIIADKKYESINQLKTLIKKLGGKWKVVPQEVLMKDENLQLKQELKEFDKKSILMIKSEERKGKKQGFKHCPILKPMINDYLNYRKEKYKVEHELNVEQLFEKITKEVAREVDEKFF